MPTAGGLKARCMTCQANRIMLNPIVKRTKNNHKLARGKCPVCAGKMALFVPSSTRVGKIGMHTATMRPAMVKRTTGMRKMTTGMRKMTTGVRRR